MQPFTKQIKLLILFALLSETHAISSWLPWNWGSKKINGGWSKWSSWSSCQDKGLQTFRFKERTCTNPSPKNGGAICDGIALKKSPCLNCNSPLGMESKRIDKEQLSASSSHGEFPPQNGRLNGKSAWCMGSKTREIYFQIDLKVLTTISAIATQGFFPDPSLLSLRRGRVSKYRIAYSGDSVNWELYKEGKIFRGNENKNGTVLNVLEPEIMARFIKIYPASFFGFICMKLELYGCSFNCGGYLTHSPGNISITSSKAIERDCLWQISLPLDTKKMFLDFVSFDVPCANGVVEVRSGQSMYGSAPVLARYCDIAETPPHLSDNGGKLWVRFKSNSSDPFVGFLANYHPSCGGRLTTDDVELKSINFPGDYFHNMKCGWTITAQKGKSVLMKILRFDVIGDRNRQRCPGDHFSVRDGVDNAAPLIGRFCNSKRPPQFICSTGYGIRIKFKSDDAISGKGFHVVFRAIEPNSTCSDPISSTSTIVMPLQTSFIFSSQPLTPSLSLTSSSMNSTFNIQLISPMPNTVLQKNQTNIITSISLQQLFLQPSVNASLMNTSGGDTSFVQKSVPTKKKDDEDDDALTTIIIIAVFSFIVLCMVIASVTPSIIHHMDKRKLQRQREISNCSLSGIEDGTLDKEGCEVIPMLPLQRSSTIIAAEEDGILEPLVLCGRKFSADGMEGHSPSCSKGSLETQPEGESPVINEGCSIRATLPVDQSSVVSNRSSLVSEASSTNTLSSEGDNTEIPSENDDSPFDSQRNSTELSADDFQSIDEEVAAICSSPVSFQSHPSQDSWNDVTSCELEYDNTDLMFADEEDMDVSLDFAAEMQSMLNQFMNHSEDKDFNSPLQAVNSSTSVESDLGDTHSDKNDINESPAVDNSKYSDNEHRNTVVSPELRDEKPKTGLVGCSVSSSSEDISMPSPLTANVGDACSSDNSTEVAQGSADLGQALTDLQSTLTASSDSDSLSEDMKVNALLTAGAEVGDGNNNKDTENRPVSSGSCPIWELQPDWQQETQGGQSDDQTQATVSSVDTDAAVPYTLCFNDNKDSGCPSSISTECIHSSVDDCLGGLETGTKETSV